MPIAPPAPPPAAPARTVTIPAVAKAQIAALQKAVQVLNQNLQSFVDGCAMGLGLDLVSEKWEFNGSDTFRQVTDPPPAVTPDPGPYS